MKVGRNDPCPCGSGIKYKKCCAGKHEFGTKQTGPSEVMGELERLLNGENFSSLEEANAFLSRHMLQRNQAPRDDFHGLSPEQMHRVLNFPFDTPDLVTFPAHIDPAPHAPIMTMFNLLAEAIGEGVKATVTGNLPRKLCQDAVLAFLGEEEYQKKIRFAPIRSEKDFFDLHVTRIVAEQAEFLLLERGKFILSPQYRHLSAQHGAGGVYPRLFRAFVDGYNWGYRDRWPEIPMIQQSFLFTLYLLQKYGEKWRPNSFYQDCFLQAFPMLLDTVQPMGNFFSAEFVLLNCYSLRSLEGFAEFLGLVEIERDPNDRYADAFRLKKLPLLDHAVKFHL